MLSHLVLILAAALPAQAPLPRADHETGAVTELLSEIEARGSAAVLAEVYEDDQRWRTVLEGIASGSRGWLRVAERLKPSARNQAEELTLAVARALESQPSHVLSLLGDVFDADDVCSLNTLEESLGPAYAGALRTVEKRERAVAKVADPEVRQQRDECLAFLRELKREVIRNRTTWFPG